MNSLIEFAVRRAQFTIVVFVMLAAVGISALLSIAKSEDPTFPLPAFAVVTIMPGASPGDVESLVVDPLERRLKALDDVKSLKTEIADGLAVVQVEFIAGTDPAKKHDDVLREVNAARPSLPSSVHSIEVKKFNAANVAVLQIALLSETAPNRELEALADRWKKRFEATPGVRDAAKWALPTQEVRVALDLPRLAALGLAPTQIAGAIATTNVNIPGGSIDVGPTRLNVKTSGDYVSLEQLRDTVVAGGPDGVVHLRDVATVELRDGDVTYLGRFNGKRAAFVTATMKEGQDILTVQKALQAQVRALTSELPSHTQAAVVFDQSRNVWHRLSGFARDFAIAILLVLVTLLPLGLRASLVVMLSIPLSLAMGLAMLYFAGHSINQLSIVGFVIALGLLVDDSIVVVENIARHLREGLPPIEAALRGTRQIAISVVGCTATLLFSFLPLLFLPGTAGQFIRSLPLAVVFTVASSLIVALTIIPFLSSLLLKRETHEEGNAFLRLLHRGIEGTYRPILRRVLARPYLTVIAATLLFAGSLALIPKIGFSLFPKAGIPQFLVRIETPDGTTLQETDRAARHVEAVLRRHPEVASFATNVGQGNPMIYYNYAPKNQASNGGEVFAELQHFDPDHSPQLLETIRQELRTYPGARLELKEFENGPPIDAPIAVRVLGDDQQQLERLAAEVERVFVATPGTRDVDNPSRLHKADLRVAIDRARAGSLGISLLEVDRAVRLGVTGLTVGAYREGGSDVDARDINLTLPRAGNHASLASLDAIYLGTATGAQVPLAQVASLQLEGSPATLRHFDRERSVTVTAFTQPGFQTDRVTTEALARLRSITVPDGYRLMPAGEVESRKESFGGMGTAVLVAIFGVLAVLVLEFRTFRGTLIVASVIPLGIIGGMLALLLTGNTLSFTASIGFIALIGIEVKNSILLVDFTHQLRAEGVALDEAIAKAGETRFLPILLTTLTALGGLLPLALERSPLYSPLAWVIIGGLLTSTFLTRIVTPVVYKLLAPELEPQEARASHGPADAMAAALMPGGPATLET